MALALGANSTRTASFVKNPINNLMVKTQSQLTMSPAKTRAETADKRNDDAGCGMILKPRMILQPKPGDSETKTDDSATKNDSETKK